MTRRVLPLALGALALLVLVVVYRGGADPYRVTVPLDNAVGLKDGSQVRLGGEPIGEIKLRLGKDDRVLADLEFEDDAPPIGRDVQVRVAAANFLGQKRVELTPLGEGAKAPDGYVVPRGQITTPTDLDQVLGVLDAPTRTRLQVLINEAGEALVGRKVDLRQFLREFPLGARDATTLIRQLETDDATMRNLVVRAGRFVAEAARQRRELTRMVSAVGETAESVSAKRAELQATLAKAPGTLRTLQAALVDLQRTTVPLRPAAQAITAAAPPLGQTLAEVDGFREAAAPTLETATRVAPDLSELGKGATPVVKRAAPTARRLSEAAAALVGVTDSLDGSVENIFAILENWSRAIQFRDQLGHVFRGEASVSPDLVLSAVSRLAPKTPAKKEDRETKKALAAAPKPAPAAPELDDVLKDIPKTKELKDKLKDLPKHPTVEQVGDALKDVVGSLTAPQGQPKGDQPADVTGFLDLLLGR